MVYAFLVNESKNYLFIVDSFAKNAAAFFRIRFSSLSLTSSFSACLSLSRSLTSRLV